MGYWRVSDNVHGLESSRTAGCSRHRVLLLCLVLMLGCSSCDRFGGDKKQDAAAPAEAVQKMPLPQHAEQKPVTDARPVPAEMQASLPAAPAEKQGVQPKRDDTPKTALDKRSQPTPDGGKAKQEKTSIKPTPQQASKAAAPLAKKATPVAKPAAVAAKRVDRKRTGASVHKKTPAASTARSWSVVMGPYMLEETLASDLARVRKSGLTAAIQSAGRLKTAMNRLFLAQFDNRGAAQAELDKLKRHTSDAFMLEHGGKHAVYAGSYLLDGRAQSEKERLAAAGFKLTVKRTFVAVPARRLVAGTYGSRAAAENVQKRLKTLGLGSTLVGNK